MQFYAKPIDAEKCEGIRTPVLYEEDVLEIARRQVLIAWKEEGLFHSLYLDAATQPYQTTTFILTLDGG